MYLRVLIAGLFLFLVGALSFSLPALAQHNVPPPPSKNQAQAKQAIEAANSGIEGASNILESGKAISIIKRVGTPAQIGKVAEGLKVTQKIVNGSVAVSESLVRQDAQPVLGFAEDWLSEKAIDKAVSLGCGVVSPGPFAKKGCESVFGSSYALGEFAEPYVDKIPTLWSDKTLTDHIYDNVTRPMLGQPDLNDEAHWKKVEDDFRARMEARKAQNTVSAQLPLVDMTSYDSTPDPFLGVISQFNNVLAQQAMLQSATQAQQQSSAPVYTSSPAQQQTSAPANNCSEDNCYCRCAK